MKKVLLTIFLSFIYINVYAANLELKTDGKAVINEKDSITVNVNLNLSEGDDFENISFDLDFNSELLKVEEIKNTFGYAQNSNGNNYVVVKYDKDFADGTIASFKVTNTSMEDGVAELVIKNIKVKTSAGTETITLEKDPTLSITLKKAITTTTRALNSSAEITGFTVSNNATIKPKFSKEVKEYKIYTGKDTIKQVTITPIYEQTGVQMEVECTLGCIPDTTTINKINLTIGKNEAIFSFTSEDGKATAVYKYIIYRGPTTDGSNLLSSLKLEGFDLEEKFDKSSLDYNVKVPYDTEEVKVLATPEDENADVAIKGEKDLKVGENVITITVTSAETTEKKIYNITVTREEFVPETENNTVVAPKIEEEAKPEVKPTGSRNIKLLLIIGGISTLIILIAAYFIFFFKKKSKKKVKSKEDAISKEEVKPRLKNELIDEDKEPTSVEDALKDLMQTKEMSKYIDDDDK